MSTKPLRAVVVDDDFMIAKLHGQFVQSMPDYELAGLAHSAEQALALLAECEPDLLLLDVYMPDNSGLDLLRAIRTEKRRCDVILITAAKELEIVEEGLQLGVFDYLIKPFDLSRFQKSLSKYATYRSRLTLSPARTLDQSTIDDLKKMRAISTATAKRELPKGIDLRTLERIEHSLRQEADFVTAEEMAGKVGVSRSTARTYLAHLVEENVVEEQLMYGTVGRPQRLYKIR